MALLFLVIWPSIGLWNAMVTRPETVRRAISAGVLTAAVCVLLTIGLVGWLVLAYSASNVSKPYVRGLSRAIWLPKDLEAEDATQQALDLYSGLDKIPEERRAEIFADRVFADQIAFAPTAMAVMLLVGGLLSVPIVYGTVYAFVLRQRGLSTWLLLVRYAIAWLASSMAVVFLLTVIIEGGRISGTPAREMPGTVVTGILIGLAVTYLALRRWKKPKVNDKVVQ